MTSSFPPQTEIEFTRLGRLVRLLAIRCHDPVDNICFLSSQAVYNLYCILLQQKRMKNLLLCPSSLPLRPDHPHTLCPRRVNFKKFHWGTCLQTSTDLLGTRYLHRKQFFWTCFSSSSWDPHSYSVLSLFWGRECGGSSDLCSHHFLS